MLRFDNLHLMRDGRILFGPLTAYVARGSCLGITGPSGAGKTTLLRAVLDPRRRSWIGDGAISVTAASLSYVPQGRSLPKGFRAGRLVELATPRASAGRRSEVIEALGLSPTLLRYEADLSGGEAQRLAIACALLSAPDLLVLDEPFAHLDLPLKLRVADVIEDEIVRGRIGAVLMVSHDLETLVTLSDQVAILTPGAPVPVVEVQGARPKGSGFINSAPAQEARSSILELITPAGGAEARAAGRIAG
jgi:sulfonate transport system ATP-binding protein